MQLDRHLVFLVFPASSATYQANKVVINVVKTLRRMSRNAQHRVMRVLKVDQQELAAWCARHVLQAPTLTNPNHVLLVQQDMLP